jgi:predicted DNA-binding protein YlxM (UPF0122 family)
MNNLARSGDRDIQITAAYEDGATSQQLADLYGISRERICQILRRSNAIELRASRRKTVMATFEREASAIKQAAKEDFDECLGRAIELVREGRSLAEAGREVGFNRTKVNFLGAACKKAGVATLHGRWRDNGPKISRVRELRATGMKWIDISAICEAERMGPVTQPWLNHHCPDLIRRGRRRNTGSANSLAKAAPHPPRDDDWTQERVDYLVRLWLNGSSAQQCADILGMTRNAIIGKINRVRTAGQLKNDAS